jgi:hypothetical protein
MNDNDLITVSVHLIHGNPVKFEVRLTEAKEFGLGDDIEKALTRTSMAVELDGKLIIIPYSNIQYVECDPAPSVLPLTIIRGAKRLSN